MKNVFVMNSMGRCGSTTLFNFVWDYYKQSGQPFYTQPSSLGPRPRFLINIKDRDLSLNANDMVEVWKSHDRVCPEEIPDNTRIVYQFGDPRDVVLSTVYGNVNRDIHVRQHLGVDDSWMGTDRWMYEDVLGLEEHFDNWTSKKRDNILLVGYSEMWNSINETLDFLKIPSSEAAKFPKKRARKYSWKNLPKQDADQMTATYSRLIEKMTALLDR